MKIFSSIKKSRRASSDIDEKIEYLNKELEKTGLLEFMTTSNIYVSGRSVDNPIYSSFTTSVFNTKTLGFSGSDGFGLGGAYVGKMVPSEVGLSFGSHDDILNTDGAALSPPHPVSGKRQYATTRLGGMIGQQFFPTQPGKIQGTRENATGSVAWLWDPNQNNSDDTTGNWYPLEFEPTNALWGFWDTNFMGFGFLNTNLSALEFTPGDNTGASVVSLFDTIGITSKGVIGTEKTIVLQQNGLGDVEFLPIPQVNLSRQGFDYLKGRARRARGTGFINRERARGTGLITIDGGTRRSRGRDIALTQRPTKSRQEVRGDKVKQMRGEGDNVGANIFHTSDRLKELESKKSLTYREESELKDLQQYNEWVSTFDTPKNFTSVADEQKAFDTQASEEKKSFSNQFKNNSNEIASNIASYIESTPDLSAEEKQTISKIANDIRSGKTLDEVLKDNIEPPSDTNTSTPPPPKPTPKIPEGVGSTTTEHQFPNGTSGTKIQTNDGKTTIFKNSDGEFVEANGKTAEQNQLLNQIGKGKNTLTIGGAVVTGTIATHQPSAAEIEQFITSLNGDMFKNGKITVTGTELPYQDGNIKVTYDKNGKRVIESNRDPNGNQGANFPDNSIDAPTNASMSLYGKPNLQAVFPPDGSTPYVLLRKYAYENTDAHDPNSPSYDPSEVPEGLGLGSKIAHALGNVFNESILGKALGLFQKNKIPDHVKDMGIHGMAYTEERIPFTDPRMTEEFKNQFEGNDDHDSWNEAKKSKETAGKYPPPNQEAEVDLPDGGKVKYYNKGIRTRPDGTKYMEMLVLPWIEPKAGVHDGYFGSLHNPGSYTTKIEMNHLPDAEPYEAKGDLMPSNPDFRGAGNNKKFTPPPKPKPKNVRGSGARNNRRRVNESLTEEAKLGHFEPEQLNVDIEKLRKGILPEFPKDPPPKMVDGYSEKSKLAPKKDEGDPDPFITISKKDLAKNHMLKDSEIKKFMDDIDLINKFIKENPSELIYAQQRYPKDDPRLAQLNWKMDQMLDAGKEYMDKHYPENKKLFKKIQKAIGQNIELTDPKSFKDVEVPKFKGVDLTDFKRRKEVVARHYKKAVKIERLFSNKKRRNNIKEEIEYKKTNLQEIMTTSNMYVDGGRVPNQDFSDFEGTSQGGQGLALSGADGNTAGNAVLGDASGFTGVALSPPHPTTGVRKSAVHIRDGTGSSTPLRPGVTITRGSGDNPPSYTMGSVLWFYDSSYNSGEGQWCNLEYSNFDGDTKDKYGFWDTNDSGFYFFNTNIGEHPCASDGLADKIAGLSFGVGGALGTSQTLVLTKTDLGDPDHLPIDIPGLSPEAVKYLLAGANYDLYMWMLKAYPNKPEAAEWYLKTGKTQGNPFLGPRDYVPRADAGGDKTEIALPPAAVLATMAALGITFKGAEAAWKLYRKYKQQIDQKMKEMKAQQGHTASYEPEGDLLSEGIKLGHFEPEQLNVNIEDLRKGIMPEFPKNPPPEMIDGYAANSRLAPKELDRAPYIKITKKDLAQNHKLKDSEIKDFMNKINAVNDFIKKHPEKLVYAQTRYPKDDPRLAQLNWQMDQMLDASKEYIDKQYSENQKLFKKVQRSIKKNIELTDPKSFKGVKVPKFKGIDLIDFKRRKEVVSRHYKKVVKIKSLFNRKKT